jgi:sigma-B regulation protein RsbU (phosphoserine phosphatase)
MKNNNSTDQDIPNILIVDDIPANLKGLADILEGNGYKVRPVTNGKLALKLAEKEKPDLILLDIMMPDLNGFEVCRRIKENQNLIDVPIIFISALNDTNDIVKAFNAGGIDYITKPFRIEEVLARVATHLKLCRQNKELQKLNADKDRYLSDLMSSKAMLEKQKEEIEKINKSVMDSINYTKRIQFAVFPQEEFINEFLPEYFVFLKPRDIVSGDFYWIKQIDNYIFLAVADCTGHGVPGAFMSMMGNAFMNEITGHDGFLKPGEILDKLRELIKKTLRHSYKSSTINDGMDIALIKLNLQTRELEFSGAHHPLIWIQKDTVTGAPVVNEIKGDRMPIGIYSKEKPFTTLTIQLAPDDMLYLFTDGFVDQFGGAANNKYMLKPFINFLTPLSNYNMREQKDRLNQELISWMKNNKQIDDILVVGIRILEKYGDVDLF